MTLIKRTKREEVATDNEKRQKETKRLRERLIERDGNSRRGRETSVSGDEETAPYRGRAGEKECVSGSARQVILVSLISTVI